MNQSARVRRTAALLLALLAAPLAARADDPPPPLAAPAAPALLRPLEVHGFIDFAATLNANRPADNGNFFTGVGTTGVRADEFSLNLAEIDVQLPPAPVGLHLTLGVGTGTEVVHEGEITGPGTSPSLWRFVEQASISYQTNLGRGLLIEGGIFPSHVGLESLASKDNWTYTRSYLGEFSPYYQAGLKASYAFSDSFSAQLHLLNGWNLIGDNNTGKTLGLQLAFKLGAAVLTLNGLAGPELPGDTTDGRYLADSILTVPLSSALELAATADVGAQQLPSAPTAVWKAAALLLRRHLSPFALVTLRGEVFDDPDVGGITGTPQRLTGGTATLELLPAPNLSLKIEGRYDHSTASVFSGRDRQPDGTPIRLRNELIAAFGAVASF